jgi:chromosome partitioning protein
LAAKGRSLPRIAGRGRNEAATRSGRGRTVAVYSVKGGVGKTTIAANLSWYASAGYGYRTLLWDLDASGGAGFLLGVRPKASRTASDIFSQSREPSALVRPTAFESLDVLPADESIRALDAQLLGIGKKRRLAKLADRLALTYERIVIDCPPVLNELSAQIMRAADVVIVPLPPSPLSARAYELVVEEVSANGKAHPPIVPVLSMLDMRRALHREACDTNPDFPVIPQASAIEQCAVQQRPLGVIAPHSPAAHRFDLLWRTIDDLLTD